MAGATVNTPANKTTKTRFVGEAKRLNVVLLAEAGPVEAKGWSSP
jgi:hypothetical protein